MPGSHHFLQNIIQLSPGANKGAIPSPVTTSNICPKWKMLCLKQAALKLQLISQSFPIKAARSILGVYNGRFDVPAACCSLIASLVVLLVNWGWGGRREAADSVPTC